MAGLCLLAAALGAITHLRASPPFTGMVPAGVIPSAIALDSGAGHAFVVNSGSDSVSVLDMRSGEVLRTTRVGHNPIAVEVDPRKHRAFVLNNADGTITTLDTESGAPLAVSATLHAKDLALDEQHGYVYVAGWDREGGDGVAVLDARSGRLFVVNGGPTPQPAAGRTLGWLPDWLRRWLPGRTPAPATASAGSVSVLDTTGW